MQVSHFTALIANPAGIFRRVTRTEKCSRVRPASGAIGTGRLLPSAPCIGRLRRSRPAPRDLAGARRCLPGASSDKNSQVRSMFHTIKLTAKTDNGDHLTSKVPLHGDFKDVRDHSSAS